jgi:hypothetical protein
MGTQCVAHTCRTENGLWAACETVYHAANSFVPVYLALAPRSGGPGLGDRHVFVWFRITV